METLIKALIAVGLANYIISVYVSVSRMYFLVRVLCLVTGLLNKFGPYLMLKDNYMHRALY